MQQTLGCWPDARRAVTAASYGRLPTSRETVAFHERSDQNSLLSIGYVSKSRSSCHFPFPINLRREERSLSLDATKANTPAPADTPSNTSANDYVSRSLHSRSNRFPLTRQFILKATSVSLKSRSLQKKGKENGLHLPQYPAKMPYHTVQFLFFYLSTTIDKRSTYIFCPEYFMFFWFRGIVVYLYS